MSASLLDSTLRTECFETGMRVRIDPLVRFEIVRRALLHGAVLSTEELAELQEMYAKGVRPLQRLAAYEANIMLAYEDELASNREADSPIEPVLPSFGSTGFHNELGVRHETCTGNTRVEATAEYSRGHHVINISRASTDRNGNALPAWRTAPPSEKLLAKFHKEPGNEQYHRSVLVTRIFRDQIIMTLATGTVPNAECLPLIAEGVTFLLGTAEVPEGFYQYGGKHIQEPVPHAKVLDWLTKWVIAREGAWRRAARHRFERPVAA